MPMEPRACSAVWHRDTQSITVRLATQTPSRAQADVAQVLGMEAARVRVVCPSVGGAFGARASVSPEDLFVALVAQHLRATVRWTATRSEDFSAVCEGEEPPGRPSLAERARAYPRLSRTNAVHPGCLVALLGCGPLAQCSAHPARTVQRAAGQGRRPRHPVECGTGADVTAVPGGPKPPC